VWCEFVCGVFVICGVCVVFVGVVSSVCGLWCLFFEVCVFVVCLCVR
jgi:hypothetical protein